MQPRLWPLTALQRDIVSACLLTDADNYVATTHLRCEPSHRIAASAFEAALHQLYAKYDVLRVSVHVDEHLEPLQVVHADVTPWVHVVAAGSPEPTVKIALDVPQLLHWTLHVDEQNVVTAVTLAAHHVILDAAGSRALVRSLNALLVPHEGGSLVTSGLGFEAVLAERIGYLDGAEVEAIAESGAPKSTAGTAGSVTLSPQAQSWLRPETLDTPPLQRIVELNSTAITHAAKHAGVTAAVLLRVAFLYAVDVVAGSAARTTVIHSGRQEAWQYDVVGMLSLAAQTSLGTVATEPNTLAETLQRHLRVSAAEADPATSRPQRERALALLSIDSGGIPDNAGNTGSTGSPGSEPVSIESVADTLDYPIAATITLGAPTITAELQVAGGITYAAEILDALSAAMQKLLEFTSTAATCLTDLAVSLHDVAPWAASDIIRGEFAPDESSELPRISALVASAAQRQPTTLAVTTTTANGRTDSLTYRDLTALAHRLAERLRDAARTAYSVGETAVVAITLPRGVGSAVAILAGLEAGVAVLPLDPKLPRERREKLLAAADARLELGSNETLPPTNTTGFTISVRGKHNPAPSKAQTQAGEQWHPDVSLDAVAAITLTSGTSGLPKVVLISHRALATLAHRNAQKLYPRPHTEPLRIGHSAAFFFDAHWDAFLALTCGHSLYILDDECLADPFDIATAIAAHDLEYADFTPTLWQLILDTGLLRKLPAICAVGGEAFTPTLWQRMRSLPGAATMSNLYGPSECTVDACSADVSETETVTIGRPTGHNSALILDESLRPVPAGIVGELYLGGPQLAHGYAGRSAETASRFVAHPLEPGARMYRTGDAAVRDAAGRIHLQGRTDDQLSLHGLRIEPAEIEAALMSLPGISAAHVCVFRDRLCAVVAPNVDSAQTLAALSDDLPRSLVPAVLTSVVAMPSNAQGKIDRTAIREILGRVLPPLTVAPGAAATSSSADADADADKILVASVAAVLQCDPAHVDLVASLAQLGGDSITGIRVAAAVRSRGYVVTASAITYAESLRAVVPQMVPMQGITETITPEHSGSNPIAGAAALVLADEAHAASAAAAHHGWGNVVDAAPLLPTQVGMLFDAEQRGDDVYVATTTLAPQREGVKLGAASVRAAWHATLALHPQLLVGVWQGGLSEPVAYTVSRPPVSVRMNPTTNRQQLATVERPPGSLVCLDIHTETEAAPKAAPESATESATGHGPAVQSLTLHVHHALADGMSMPILLSTLQQQLTEQLKNQLTEQNTPTAPTHPAQATPLALQREYAAALTNHIASAPGGATAAAIMRREFDAATPFIVVERPAPRVRITRILPLNEPVPAVAATALQVAVAHALGRASGRRDLAFALAMSGRDVPAPGIESAVGMFMATTAQRFAVEPDMPESRAELDALLMQARSAMARTAPAHLMGWGRLIRALAPEASVAAAPSNVLLVVESQTLRTPTNSENIDPLRVVGADDATTFPLAFTATFAGAQISVEVESTTAAVPAALATALAETAVAALAALLGQPVPTAVAQPLRGGELPLENAPALRLPALRLPEPGAGGAEVMAEAGHASGAETFAESGADFFAGQHGSTSPATDKIAATISRHFDLLLGATTQTQNFVQRGGDSLLAMRLVGALRGEGLRLSIRDLYAHPTPRELAQALATAHESTQAAAGATSGVLAPNTQIVAGQTVANPALAWWLEQGEPAAKMTQTRSFTLPHDVQTLATVARVRQALIELYARHDALRLTPLADGQFTVVPFHAAQLPTVNADVSIGLQARDAVDANADTAAALRTATDTAHNLLDVAKGVLFTAVRCNAEIVFAAHHLCVDGYSWQILLAEFESLLRGNSHLLPPAGSFAQWQAEQPQRIVAARADASYWAATLSAAKHSTANSVETSSVNSAVNSASNGAATISRSSALSSALSSAQSTPTDLTVALDATATAALIDLTKTIDLRLDEALCLAVLLASGAPEIIEVEGHGRNESSTSAHAAAVGWFTATWPVPCPALAAPNTSNTTSTTSTANTGSTGTLASAMSATLVRLREARQRALSYGLLRYLDPEHSPILAQLEAAAGPRVLVNYLGALGSGDAMLDEPGTAPHLTDAADLNAHLETDPETHAVHLQVAVRSQVTRITAPKVLRALEQLINLDATTWSRCIALAEPARRQEIAPAPLDLDAMGVDSTFNLTPVQRAMLRDHTTAGYIGALAFDIGATPEALVTRETLATPEALVTRENFNVERYREAWETVILAEPALRLVTLTGPTREQVAGSSSDLTRVFHFTSQNPADPLATEPELTPSPDLINRFKQGLNLAVTCTPTPSSSSGDVVARVLLHSHHAILDGWSMPRLIEAVHETYIALSHETQHPTQHPTRRRVKTLPPEHVQALHTGIAREASAATALVAGLAGARPTLFPARNFEPADAWFTAQRVMAGWPAMEAAARAAGVTTAALLHAAFALTLSALTGEAKPLFGTVHSARTAELEATLGMFITTLPCAIDTGAAANPTPESLLHTAHATLGLLHEQQHASVNAVAREWPENAAGHLFDTLLVVENYPAPQASALPLLHMRADDQTEYPLNCTAEIVASASGANELHVRFECAGDVFAPEAAQLLLSDFTARLRELCTRKSAEARTETSTLPSTAQQITPQITQQNPQHKPQQNPAPSLRAACGLNDTTTPSDPQRVAATAARLAPCFAEVLQRDEVPLHGNLYALGGDSLSVMRLVTVLQREGWRVRTSSIAAHPTPQSLAAHIEQLNTQPAQLPAQHPVKQPLLALSGGALAALTSHVKAISHD